MPAPVIETASNRLQFTASTALSNSGFLMGILVSQSSAGTIKVEDGQGVIADTISVVAGQYYPMPCMFFDGLTVTVGGTLSATLFYTV